MLSSSPLERITSSSSARKMFEISFLTSLTDSAQILSDAVGGPGLEELAWATKRFGRIIVYGALEATDEETRLPLGACFLRGVKVYAGVTIFDYTGNRRLGLPPKPGAVNRAKEFITKGLAAGKLTPKIDRVFNGLGEYQLANQYIATNSPNGKIIISL